MLTIVNHHYTASQWSYLVVCPTKMFKRIQIFRLKSIVIKFHQTSKPHYNPLVSITYMTHWIIPFQHTVSHMYHVSEDTPLEERLTGTIKLECSIVDIVPCIIFPPMTMYLLGGEEIIECDSTCQFCMLYAPGKPEELLA